MGFLCWLLRCVFDPRVGVVALVALRAVGDGNGSGGAVVVCNGVDIHQAFGSGFDKTRNAAAIGDGKGSGGAVVIGDCEDIRQPGGAGFTDALDAAAIFYRDIIGRIVRQGDGVCIQQTAGPCFLNAPDAAVAVQPGQGVFDKRRPFQFFRFAPLLQDV